MRKKKVALTTWFNYFNYGSALQAVALSYTIKSLGYDVDVVNYIPHGTRYSDDKATDWSELERVSDSVRENKFEKFIRKNLTFTDECKDDDDFELLNDKYDAFVAGSDQIWSPIVYDSRYYLDYVGDNRKKIAYAPSTGVVEIKNPTVKEYVSNLVSQFASLSARESAGRNLIEDLICRKPDLVLDPTLLLNYDDWRKIIPVNKTARKSENYILCYFLGDNDNSWVHANQISIELNLPLKVVPVFAKDNSYGESYDGVGPEEFFNLIDNAEVILTDSYHAAIMALICCKQFYVFERFHRNDPISQNSRIYELLNLVELTHYLIGYDEGLRKRYSFDKNHRDEISKIYDEQKKSVAYLRDSLSIKYPLVSVIVPVYNVEGYLERCLDSILGQTYHNLEIIVVDDGSTDKSGGITDKYSIKDRRIKVLHKGNQGVSLARNEGLDIATGDYVMFIDADDVVAPNYIEYMLGLVENNAVNIGASIYSYNEYCDEKNITTLKDRIELYTPQRAIEGIYNWSMPLAVWNKIYKRSFIETNQLRFLPQLVFAEGMTFNIMALQISGPIAVGKKQLYYQTFNPSSATRSTNISGWETCTVAYKYQKENSTIWNDNIDRAYDFHCWLNNLAIARQIYKAGEEEKYAKYLQRYIRNMRKNILPVLRADMTRGQKIKHLRIAINPKKELNEINRREAERVNNSDLLNTDIMPWERQSKNSELNITSQQASSPEKGLEIGSLRLENEILRSEIASFLSIKRAARLLAGNIKRLIIQGKNRK